MTTVVLMLVSFAAGVLVGASALHWIRDRRRRERAPGFVGTDMSWPGNPIHIIDAEHIEASLRGDV